MDDVIFGKSQVDNPDQWTQDEHLSSDAVLGEGFDVDTAIKNMGNCQNQRVDCKVCKMGKFIFKNGMKTRVDDLCQHEIVFILAKVVKTFA